MLEARFQLDFDPENPDCGLGLELTLDGQTFPIETDQPFRVDISNVGRTDTAVGGYPPLPPHLLEISVVEVKGGTVFFKQGLHKFL